MAILDELLSRGYFPKELPECFKTLRFGQFISGIRGTLPKQFMNSPVTKPVPYSLARAGSLRRRLGMPNPLTHLNLCECVEAEWPTISRHTAASPISLSLPVHPCPYGRALGPKVKFDDLPAARAKERRNARFIVKADLSEFYHAIYTHTLAWALHGKATAKLKQNLHNTSLLGVKLDELIRRAQDRQSVGIPIGPDTSLVVAEILLSTVDQELAKRVGGLCGLRHMDDFELCLSHQTTAEEALAELQEILLQYELRPNPRKTRIEATPVRVEDAWVRSVRDFCIRPRGIEQARDLVGFFDGLTDWQRADPQQHVVKFALGRLKTVSIDPPNWELFQNLLAESVTVEPGAVHNYLVTLSNCVASGHRLDGALLDRTLNTTIVRAVPLGHHHEAAWSVWGIISFGLVLDRAAADALSKTDNSVVVLLALDAESRGLAPTGLDHSNWLQRMTTDDLLDDQWLLSYEANVKGWLPSLGGTDHVAAEPCFGVLKKAGVSFYDTSAVLLRTAPTFY